MLDPWIRLMETYIKAGLILNHLTKEARSYIGAKPDDQKSTLKQVYNLLRRRFGIAVSQNALGFTFDNRV